MKRILIIALFSTILASCEEKIDLDVPEGPNKLVVDALLTNGDSVQTITLSRTSAYFESSRTPRITDAIVYVTSSKNDTVYFNHNDQSPGDYVANMVLSDTTISYNLSVLADGKTYRSFSEQLRRVHPIDSMRQSEERFPEQGDFREEGYALLLTTFEIEGRGDFYRWIIFVNGEKLSDPFNLIITDDRLVDGNVIRDWDIAYELKPGDFVEVHQMSISRRAFHYWSLLFNQITQFGGPFDTPPAPIEGNMYNINNPDETTLGFFGISKVEKASLLIK